MPSVRSRSSAAESGGPGARDFDADLLARSGAGEVVVLPTAAAFEHPERVGERAAAYFGELGAEVRTLPVLHRTEAEDPEIAATVRAAKFLYVADGSPLHLRSVLKGSALFDAILAAYHGGGVLAASGAGATLLCDPMVDPRGGAYTVGLGVVKNLAVFPYHGTAADHLRERSIDLLPRGGRARRHRRGDRVGQAPRRLVGRGRRWRHALRRRRCHASTAPATRVAGLPAVVRG